MSGYLILGASSEVSLAFIRLHEWKSDDEIIAQYHSNKDALEEALKNIPAKAVMRKADFLTEEGISDFVSFMNAQNFIPSKILHSNAFPVRNARLTELQWNNFHTQIMIQVRSFFEVMKSVLKGMAKSGGGKIAAVLSSCTINIPPAFMSDYITAKYALMGLVKSMASEYAARNILINMISPSMMETKFITDIYSGVIEQSAAKNPMKRNARPEDAASLAEYILSDSNTFITGANIPVTGGEEF